METPWYANICIWSALAAWFAAQGIKMVIHLVRSGELDVSLLVSTGGMPSAHSAIACGMATSVGITAGFGSPVFSVAFIITAIVMFDAQSVRRAVGLQANVLNQIIGELLRDHAISEEKLLDAAGHTEREVFAGMTVGILTALVIHAFF